MIDIANEVLELVDDDLIEKNFYVLLFIIIRIEGTNNGEIE